MKPVGRPEPSCTSRSAPAGPFFFAGIQMGESVFVKRDRIMPFQFCFRYLVIILVDT